MKQYADELNIYYTASSPGSLALFNDIIESYLSTTTDVMPLLTELLSDDPEMPMAHCLRAYLLKLAADPRFANVIQQTIKLLEQQGDRLNTRESLHLNLLSFWARNENAQAIEVAITLLKQYPQDMLALRILHYLHFYAGDITRLRQSVADAVKVWQPEQRFYGFLLGMYSFGLEEAGDYTAAESFGRQAVELNQQDMWAAHAVAHVMEMQGRYQEGVDWTASLLPLWRDGNNFIYHLHWHQALFHIGLNEYDAALNIYDQTLTAPLKDDFYLDICNNGSLLWRLEMRDVNIGDRWQALEHYAEARLNDDELVFSTLHYLLPAARLGNKSLVTDALAHFESWAKQSDCQANVCQAVGRDLAQGIVHLANKDFKAAARFIQRAEPEMHLIGGSHAQRQLFSQMRAYAADR